MKLYGHLERALAGNFICLRGYAPMKLLNDISQADAGYQRELITTHYDKMVTFLDDQHYLFFPEVILGTSLTENQKTPDGLPIINEQNGKILNEFWSSFHSNKSGTYSFLNFKLKNTTDTHVDSDHEGAKKYIKRATLTMHKNFKYKFHRIDGNHRLSVLDDSEKLNNDQRQKFEELNVPFCLLLFESIEDLNKNSRVLFHNLNFHQIPITKEKNLKLILDDDEKIFPEEKLKNAFDETYVDAREILKRNTNLGLIPHIKAVIEPNEEDKHCKRTFLVNSLELLKAKDESYDIESIEKALSYINQYFADSNMQKHSNHGLLTVYLYYALSNPQTVKIFHHWVMQNHIYLTETIKAEELIKVFDCVLKSKKRTVFVSMQFCDETRGNYEAIKKAIDEVNQSNQLDLKIQPIRIDEYMKGHSYQITDEIMSHIEGCGLLIADVTYGNKNVYHEIGFLMGLNARKDEQLENCVMVFNKNANNANFEKDLGFNLKTYQVLMCHDTGDMTSQLKVQIERFYNLAS